MRRFLILQLRPESDASDGEIEAFLNKGCLAPDRIHRIRLDQAPLPDIPLDNFAGIIVGGGPGCVSDAAEAKSPLDARMEADIMRLMPAIAKQDIPFLGCCYGIGILASYLGGSVGKARHGEAVGTSPCRLTGEGRADPILNGCPDTFDAFVGHKEALQALPPNAAHLVSSDPCPFQMIRYKRNIYATQFHPEADAAVFETRIRIYREHGYFPPEDADALIEMVHAAHVYAPERIVRNFVEIYG